MDENDRETGPEAARARLPLVRRLRRPSEVYRRVLGEPTSSLRWSDVALVFCFFLAICLPLAGLLLRLDTGFVLDENRVLASRPELSLDRAELARFPHKFELYFNDQFGFRKRLIYLLNLTKVAVLGVSPSPKVIFGAKGWLYYGSSDIRYFRAVEPLRAEQLWGWQKRLEERERWLADRGIPYLIVFAPLKSTIYPENMPRCYNRIGTESRLDQFLAHLKAHSKLTVLDLRPAIRDEKTRHQVFYRTDTHWNNRGSYVGYSQIMKSLGRWFPEIKALPPSAFEEANYSEPGRDLPLLLGMRPYFWDRYVDLKLMKKPLAHQITPPPPPGKFETTGPDILFEHPDKRLPRAVMFRDSFAMWLTPLLSESFSHILYSWQYTFDRGIVEREHPDIVIHEMVERVLIDDSPPSP